MARRRIVTPVLLTILLALFGAALMLGPANIAPERIVAAALGHGDDAVAIILHEIRLPRALLALSIGATLGLAGAVLQGLLRNPLAEPGLLGASSGAALGAVTVLSFGLAGAFSLLLPLAGVAGALVSVVVLLGAVRGGHDSLRLILGGVAISALAGAGVALALNLAPNYFAALEITFWLLGSLEDRSFLHVRLALPLMALSWILLVAAARSLDSLGLGEDTAASLGHDLRRTRFLTIAGTGLGVGAAVAVSGVIGFIGLVAPHIARALVGHSPSRILLPSALIGAALLTVSDILVRVLPTNQVLKLGVVTGLVGAPAILVILRRSLIR